MKVVFNMGQEVNKTIINLDAYSPSEVSIRVENIGVAKAQMSILKTLILAILAGAFIALGASFYLMTITDSQLGFGLTRLIGGLVFSLGLILVIVAGAELFTGNNLIVMAYIDKKITLQQMLYNWGIVFIGNFLGAVAIAFMVYFSGIWEVNHAVMAQVAISISEAKVHLTISEAFFRAILCNILVCLAVWLAFAAHTVTGKILAIIFPIAAFVTLGFEHSIANLFFLPFGYMLGAEIDLASAFYITSTVIIGNIIGGSGFVAASYWVIYRYNIT